LIAPVAEVFARRAFKKSRNMVTPTAARAAIRAVASNRDIVAPPFKTVAPNVTNARQGRCLGPWIEERCVMMEIGKEEDAVEDEVPASVPLGHEAASEKRKIENLHCYRKQDDQHHRRKPVQDDEGPDDDVEYLHELKQIHAREEIDEFEGKTPPGGLGIEKQEIVQSGRQIECAEKYSDELYDVGLGRFHVCSMFGAADAGVTPVIRAISLT
jgi:hypothetical protein